MSSAPRAGPALAQYRGHPPRRAGGWTTTGLRWSHHRLRPLPRPHAHRPIWSPWSRDSLRPHRPLSTKGTPLSSELQVGSGPVPHPGASSRCVHACSPTNLTAAQGMCWTGASGGDGMSARPLDGVRGGGGVGSFVASPLCGLTLAQLGAEVIRVDPAGGAADVNRWPLTADGHSIYWTGLEQGQEVGHRRSAFARRPETGAGPGHRVRSRWRHPGHQCRWAVMDELRHPGRVTGLGCDHLELLGRTDGTRRRLHRQRGPRFSITGRSMRTANRRCGESCFCLHGMSSAVRGAGDHGGGAAAATRRGLGRVSPCPG